jgi:signal transduction histidine kinase
MLHFPLGKEASFHTMLLRLWNRYHWLCTLGLFITVGAVVSYLDHQLNFHTILVEVVHGLVVTSIFAFCLYCERKYPTIRQFGWRYIVIGLGLLAMGSWVDILDDPPTLSWLTLNGIPFGRSWEQAFLKKILGYTVGIGLVSYGLARWIPWMIQTRRDVELLNQKLGSANTQLNRIRMSLEDHIESERLNISRELHDDVAQQLTALKLQLQVCQKRLNQEQAALSDTANEHLTALGDEISSILQSVRAISHNLRPESLYTLGLEDAFEQFLSKMRTQYPAVTLHFEIALPKDLANLSSEPISLDHALEEHARLHLFRILQEGVRNALKHAQAKHISVRLEPASDLLSVSIVDDGKGLPWSSLPSDEILVSQGHLGLVGLKERVKALHGEFQLFQECKLQEKAMKTRLEVAIPL